MMCGNTIIQTNRLKFIINDITGVKRNSREMRSGCAETQNEITTDDCETCI